MVDEMLEGLEGKVSAPIPNQVTPTPAARAFLAMGLQSGGDAEEPTVTEVRVRTVDARGDVDQITIWRDFGCQFGGGGCWRKLHEGHMRFMINEKGGISELKSVHPCVSYKGPFIHASATKRPRKNSRVPSKVVPQIRSMMVHLPMEDRYSFTEIFEAYVVALGDAARNNLRYFIFHK
jgi:hypothetical protein